MQYFLAAALIALIVLSRVFVHFAYKEFLYWRAQRLLRDRYAPSIGVMGMLAYRMDAAHGTPTLGQKVFARLGIGHTIGMTDAEIQATLTGENVDITKAEQALLALFHPLLTQAEATGVSDLITLGTAVLTGTPPTSIAGAIKLVGDAAKSEAGVAQTQVEAIGQTGFATLVSALVQSLGHVNLPVT